MKVTNAFIYEKKIERIMDKCKAKTNQSYHKHGNTDAGALGTLGNSLIKLISHRVPNFRMMLLVNCYCALCLICKVTGINRLVLKAPIAME